MADHAPPAPKAILRGHKAQVHAASFIRHNERLVTGDADGFAVLWDLTIMRPRAVWRAHEGAILGVMGWGEDKLITHGRDHKLVVWKVAEEDEERLSTALPLEDVPSRPQPWLMHLLEVNTMNFCAFSACSAEERSAAGGIDSASEILIAVPNTLASEAIDIYTLPTQARIHTIMPGKGNGMAMCLSILHHQGCLTLIAAFENGFASVHRLQRDGSWVMTYRSQAHTQPILSLSLQPGGESFLTSGADSIIAKHPIPATQQEVIVASHGNERVVEIEEPQEAGPSVLSAALHGSSAGGGRGAAGTIAQPWEHPLKTVNTKHSGQQSLKIRSDGRLFATAGWDSQVRVYSCKTLKELAVLQWHKVGCYAVAFADLPADQPAGSSNRDATEDGQGGAGETIGASARQVDQVVRSGTGSAGGSVMSVKDRRIQAARTAHWIAAGSKDGKVSLWDIY